MRLFFSMYQISAALDAAEPVPPSLQQKLAVNDELRHFAQSLSALDQALRNSPPKQEAPPALHASIMRSVCEIRRPAPLARKPSSIARWLPAPALAALVCALLAWYNASVRTPSRTAFAHAGTALTTSGEIARTAPATALAPLTEEWQRLHQDLDKTAEFLLAALP